MGLAVPHQSYWMSYHYLNQSRMNLSLSCSNHLLLVQESVPALVPSSLLLEPSSLLLEPSSLLLEPALKLVTSSFSSFSFSSWLPCHICISTLLNRRRWDSFRHHHHQKAPLLAIIRGSRGVWNGLPVGSKHPSKLKPSRQACLHLGLQEDR